MKNAAVAAAALLSRRASAVEVPAKQIASVVVSGAPPASDRVPLHPVIDHTRSLPAVVHKSVTTSDVRTYDYGDGGLTYFIPVHGAEPGDVKVKIYKNQLWVIAKREESQWGGGINHQHLVNLPNFKEFYCAEDFGPFELVHGEVALFLPFPPTATQIKTGSE